MSTNNFSNSGLYREFRSQGEGSSPASGSQIPESQQSGVRSFISVEQLVSQPGREHLIRLDPTRTNGTWFKFHQSIPKAIKKMIHAMLEDAYPKYSDIPIETRDIWFRCFAQEFTWDPNNTVLVRNGFDIQAAKSYSNHMHEWKKAWKKGKEIPKGVNPTVWEKLQTYWQLEKTVAQSSTNSRNRKSDRGGLGISTHNSGAKTFEMRLTELTESQGGVPPDYLTLMEETHKNKSTKEIQDPLVRNVVGRVREKYGERLSQLSDGASSSTVHVRNEINQMVLQETPLRKGGRSFLGTLPHSEQSNNAPYTEIPELRNQIQNLNEIIQEKDSVIGTMQSEMSGIKQFLQQQFPNQFPFYEPPHSPPNA